MQSENTVLYAKGHGAYTAEDRGPGYNGSRTICTASRRISGSCTRNIYPVNIGSWCGYRSFSYLDNRALLRALGGTEGPFSS
ncbi:uncharacterized protein LOC128666783 isoform X2 [Bombina bombina]|uniref:uncharacterized protein LOC128666783 isoform X2 n=1 Tax=Bombina bombina TaxID=8345 RepID=UPI00235A7B09|nr:uncharacterized protein LOC128666783 isoform X2 [Bombina bombina]